MPETRIQIANRVLSPLGINYRFQRSLMSGKKAVSLWFDDEGPGSFLRLELAGKPIGKPKLIGRIGSAEMDYDDRPTAEEFEARLGQAVVALQRCHEPVNAG